MEEEAYQEMIDEVIGGADYLVYDLTEEAEQRGDRFGQLVALLGDEAEESRWGEIVDLLDTWREEMGPLQVGSDSTSESDSTGGSGSIPQELKSLLSRLAPILEHWPAELRKVPAHWWNEAQSAAVLPPFYQLAANLEVQHSGQSSYPHFDPPVNGESLLHLEIIRVYDGFLPPKLLVHAHRCQELIFQSTLDSTYSAHATLDWLQHLPSLRRLSLTVSARASLDGLPVARQLEELSLSLTGGGSADLAPLGEIPHLRELYLAFHRSDATDLSPVECLNTLEKFTLNHYRGDLAGLKGLSKLAQLKELYISDASLLTSIEGLHSGMVLNKLELDNCQGLTSIAPLLAIPSLKEVTVTNCPQIGDFKQVQENAHFRFLE